MSTMGLNCRTVTCTGELARDRGESVATPVYGRTQSRASEGLQGGCKASDRSEHPSAQIRGSEHIPRNGHEMQEAPGNHEQMPDAVPVAKTFVVGKEDDPYRVQH